MSDRICAAPGCETLLSRFNKGELCAVCEPHFIPTFTPTFPFPSDPRIPESKPRPRVPKRDAFSGGEPKPQKPGRPKGVALVPLTDETAPPILGELCNTIQDILKGMLAE